jgi:hypothetical protein
MFRVSVLVGCFALAAHAAPPAQAAKPAAVPDETAKAARKAFEAGTKAFKAGKFAEALASFDKAYSLKPHPTVRFNIARCAEQLNDVPRALKEYRIYLTEVPEPADADTIARAVSSLERKLQQKNLQQLMVTADPADASITVDDAPLGHSPAFVELSPGLHRLRVEREGLEPVAKAFTMPTAKSFELSFVLQPLAPKAPEPKVAQPLPPPPMPPAQVVKAEQPTTPALRSKVWMPLIAVALGGVAAGVGFAETASFESKLQTELSTKMMVTTDATTFAATGKSFQLIGWVGVGVAAAGLVASAIFFFLPGSGSTVTLTPTVSLAPGGASLGLTGVFP